MPEQPSRLTVTARAMLKSVALLPAAIIAGLASVAAAEPAPRPGPVPAEVAAFAKTPAHAASVATTATETFNKLWDCTASTAAPADAVRIFPNLGPVTFGPTHVPVSGVISERVMVSGCGKSKIENVLTISDKAQSTVIAGMPGTTIADPALAHDSYTQVYQGAMTKLGACKNVRFVDSAFGAFDGAPNPKAKFQVSQGRPWREIWTVNGCGTLVPVVVRFIPDATGTTITVLAR
jgi:hypothetical protein